jgi:hypothetical protein
MFSLEKACSDLSGVWTAHSAGIPQEGWTPHGWEAFVPFGPWALPAGAPQRGLPRAPAEGSAVCMESHGFTTPAPTTFPGLMSALKTAFLKPHLN